MSQERSFSWNNFTVEVADKMVLQTQVNGSAYQYNSLLDNATSESTAFSTLLFPTIPSNLTTDATTLPFNFTDPDQYEPYRQFMVGSRYWVQKVLVPVVLLIGFLGNTVTILVLSRPRMRSSTNTYLTALAISDLLYLFSMFSLSLQHHPNMSHPSHWLYWNYCKYAYWITDASSEYISVLTRAPPSLCSGRCLH